MSLSDFLNKVDFNKLASKLDAERINPFSRTYAHGDDSARDFYASRKQGSVDVLDSNGNLVAVDGERVESELTIKMTRYAMSLDIEMNEFSAHPVINIEPEEDGYFKNRLMMLEARCLPVIKRG